MESLYDNTLQALRLSGSHASSKSDRDLAEEFLKNISMRNQAINAEIEYLQTLAVVVLGNGIDNGWESFTIHDKIALRDKLLSLVRAGAPIFSQKSVRNKLASILSSIAKKQYPKEWNSFLTDMIVIWEEKSSECQEIAILSIGQILSDCMDSDFNHLISTSKKQEIMSGFRRELDKLLIVSFEFFGLCIRVLENSVDMKDINRAKELIMATNQILEPLSIFAKPENLCSNSHNFLEIMMKQTQIEGLQLSALPVISNIVCQKLSEEFLAPVVTLFCSTTFSFEFEDDTDRLLFERSLVSIVYSFLGNNYSELFSPAWIKKNRGILEKFMEFSLFVIQGNSRLVLLDILKEWIKLARDMQFMEMSNSKSILERLMEAIYSRSHRALWKKNKNGKCIEPVDEVISLEFNDFEEYRGFYSVYKSQMRALFGSIFENVPDIVLSFLTRHIQELFSSSIYDHLDDYQQLTLDSTLSSHWSIISAIVDIACKKFAGVPKKQYQSIFDQLSSSFLQWNPTEGPLIQARIDCLSSCAHVQYQSSEFIRQSLLILFGYLNYQDKVSNQSEGTMAVIYKTTLAIVDICNVCRTALLQNFNFVEQLIDEVDKILRQKLLPSNVLVHLRETLIVLSSLFDNPAQQQQLISMGINSLFQEWNELSPHLDSLSSFLQLWSPDNLSFFTNLGDIFHSLYVCIKKVPIVNLPNQYFMPGGRSLSTSTLATMSSFTPYWPQIFAMIMKVLRLLFPIDTLEFRQQYPQLEAIHWPSIFEVRRNAGVEDIGPRSAAVDSVFFHIRKCLEDVKTSCFLILAQASMHKILYCEDVGEIKDFLLELVKSSIWMAHGDFICLLRSFGESYFTNMISGDSSRVIECCTMLMAIGIQRLGVLYHGDVGKDIHTQLLYSIVAECSIPSGYASLSGVEIEESRNTLITESFSQFADFLSVISFRKGLLVERVPGAPVRASSAPPVKIPKSRFTMQDGNNINNNTNNSKSNNNGQGFRQFGNDDDTAQSSIQSSTSTATINFDQLNLRRTLNRNVLFHNPIMLQQYTATLEEFIFFPVFSIVRKCVDICGFLFENLYRLPQLNAFFGNIFAACMATLVQEVGL